MEFEIYAEKYFYTDEVEMKRLERLGFIFQKYEDRGYRFLEEGVIVYFETVEKFLEFANTFKKIEFSGNSLKILNK